MQSICKKKSVDGAEGGEAVCTVCMHCTYDLSQRCTLEGATCEQIDTSVWKILNLDFTPFSQINHSTSCITNQLSTLCVKSLVRIKVLHDENISNL